MLPELVVRCPNLAMTLRFLATRILVFSRQGAVLPVRLDLAIPERLDSLGTPV